ncbi:MAG TPA: HDIG domain-containing protein [Deltaproteobacteria bacterium]|nr:HDIG domain-containing protein [Deltaproteobacteria bacterium]HPR56240.1 HDIG domain-containing protein [Deltaproteobacteria bacterium]HXK46183.1 HDIG domain-containing protein [Deltaproteobacteria bacterium]
MIPTLDESLRLIELHRMPGHIFAHSIMVRRVALAIGSSLLASNRDIDLRLVGSSALLHDICKMECIGNGGDHALKGMELLCRYGYPRVGDVVGQHVRLRTLALDEAMVVNYADKRVMHTRVVSLDRRFVDLMARYGTDEGRRERILGHHRVCLQMEDMIVNACNADLEGLEGLNLIPVDQTLDGG